MDCSPPGSSVSGILQARIQEWVAMPSSRWSSWSRDQAYVSWDAGGFFTVEPLRKPLSLPPSGKFFLSFYYVGSFLKSSLWSSCIRLTWGERLKPVETYSISPLWWSRGTLAPGIGLWPHCRRWASGKWEKLHLCLQLFPITVLETSRNHPLTPWLWKNCLS